MKTSFGRSLTLIVGLLIFSISSCNTYSQRSKTPNPFTSTLSPSETDVPSATKPKPTRSITLTLQSTATPQNTLEPEMAESEIRSLLTEGQDCLPTCFWGIIPNQTTMEEATNFFRYIGSPMSHGLENNNAYASTIAYNHMLIKVKLFVQNNLVRSIRTRISLENYDGPAVPRPWSAFSPENLLLQYGKPTNVEFEIYYPAERGFPEGTAWYQMIIWFDEKGVIADYFDGETKAGKLIHVCPLTDRFGSVDLWIGENPDAPSPRRVSLEEATSLTIDQFYDLMTQKDGQKCLDLRSEAFAEK